MNGPPVLPTFVSFRLMVGIGTLLILLAGWGFIKRNSLMDNPLLLKIMLFSIPAAPILQWKPAGWLQKVGRQPWIVYGMLKTADAVSPIAGTQVLFSLFGFIAVYGLLGAIGFLPDG